ncbi:nickel pincer cofactor biosynthesis protein LarC [Microlunatus aurantiacus]|uniref:Pyridinium-3,5-bisthiocarboxylic acid mononucleotide nickel insertion protein n=1 Tax=Microlunatus aurantiacus TaxID=446786 RepID=A0ABP7DBU2_9ACTN
MTGPSSGRHAWIDASAGIAGDMLLGALVDAGADLAVVQAAVDAVVPGSVRLDAAEVTRAGQRATKIAVEVITEDLPHRRWATIRDRLVEAPISTPVRDRALATFARLAEAEATAHGIAVDDVHFHEVGALDSIADVVGVSAALADLGVTTLSAGVVAVGSGRTRAAHGDLPVPVPAVVRLSVGWRVQAGGTGELTTPTGMALVATLAERCEDLPAMTVQASGAGAGTKDFPGRPNVTRVLLGELATSTGAATEGQTMIILEAGVDDLDPRLWPGVLDRLLRAGAADAWLVPIVMKKGRPAHVLTVLTQPGLATRLRQMMIDHTSTLGVRQHEVTRSALARGWASVDVDEHPVRIKIGHDATGIRQLNPEFDDVSRVAAATGRPEREVLEQARAAARRDGLELGGAAPGDLTGS